MPIPIYNQDLRFAFGAFRSSPVVSLLFMLIGQKKMQKYVVDLLCFPLVVGVLCLSCFVVHYFESFLVLQLT